ncbi:hypothetical protein BD779DRAFT_1108310 [Infundibulicybe gibba]|nr:hypothetical protein BD779DRAFT_1108310 [Infundibulicybe gibba]
MTALALPRRVIVDDADPQIQFSSEWLASDGDEDPNPNGTSGHPFQNTTHVSPWYIDSNLSFQFQGSSPQVFGVANVHAQSHYECFLDGISIPQPPGSDVYTGSEHSLLCDGTQFTEGKEYTLTLNTTGYASGPVVWIDYITYIPSSVPVGSATTLVDRLDPAIVYSPGDWTIANASLSLARSTQASGSRLTFNFTGTSVSWVGYTPQTASNESTNATYSIDGEGPQLFRLDASPFANLSNQVFFTSPNLSSGSHSLTVIYGGDNTKVPLTLNHLVVTNASTSTSSPARSIMSSASSLPSAESLTSNEPSASHTGAIVGGVIGGIAGTAMLCLAAFFLWRYSHQRRTGNSRKFSVRRGGNTASSNAVPSGPAMAEASNRTPRVHPSPVAGSSEPNPFSSLDDPSGSGGPSSTPQQMAKSPTSHPDAKSVWRKMVKCDLVTFWEIMQI